MRACFQKNCNQIKKKMLLNTWLDRIFLLQLFNIIVINCAVFISLKLKKKLHWQFIALKTELS